jgi:sulfopyruvate decarboxylase TPP-binding subunit
MTWSEPFLDAFKKNDVRFVSYVPDNVLTPLIKSVTSDNYFISVDATREDEAMGMVAGAWMGGMKGVVMMQMSGFAVAPNAAVGRPPLKSGVMRTASSTARAATTR